MQTDLDIQVYSSYNIQTRQIGIGNKFFTIQNNEPYKVLCSVDPTKFLEVGQKIKINETNNSNILYGITEVTSTYFMIDKKFICPDLVTQQLVFQAPSLIQTVGTDFPLFPEGTIIYINGTTGGLNDDAFNIISQSDDTYYLVVPTGVVNENPSPVGTTWTISRINGNYDYVLYSEVKVLEEKYERLDLFDDETIQLTLKQVDTTDISKNYADFTQTFTIPASNKNNLIFSQFYDVDNQFQFNANKKVSAKLHINTIPFRYGKVQLEKVNMKNGKPDNYSITFYSNLVKLKDLFGDDTLNSLLYEIDNETIITDATSYNYQNNNTETKYRIENKGDVIIPLISTKRIWSYDEGNEDVKFTSGNTTKTIKYDELLPSIKLFRLIELIQKRYSIKFSDDFFNNNKDNIFSKLYMWCNKFYNSSMNPSNELSLSNSSITTNYPLSISDIFYIENNFVNFDFSSFNSLGFYRGYRIVLEITFDESNINYDAIHRKYDVFINDENGKLIFSSLNNYATKDLASFIIYAQNPNTLSSDKFTIGIVSTNEKLSFKFNVRAKIYFYTTDEPPDYWFLLSSFTKIDIINTLPSMKIYDFITSLIKMFNLVIIPTPFDENSFVIKTLYDYLQDGNELDLTEYINKEKVVINRNQVYNNIKYSLDENTYYNNSQYFLSNNKQFGSDSLRNILGDSVGNGEYSVESKFWLMKSISLAGFPISYGIDKDSKFIENKPVIFCYGGHLVPVDNKFGFLLTPTLATAINSYPYMGTDDSYTKIITNKDDLITYYEDSVICSFNLTESIPGATANNSISFGVAESVGKDTLVGDIVAIDDNLFLVQSKTTAAGGGVKLVGVNLDYEELTTITPKVYLTYGNHIYKRYRNMDYNAWRSNSYPYKNSITFGNEYDFNGSLRDKNLYKNYYEKFITQLYSINTRTWEYEGHLPDNLIYYLTLSSTLKIQDKRFMIADMTINLLSGKISLKMINYTNYKLGSKQSSGERTDVLNNLVKYDVVPSNRGIVFFNGVSKTIDTIVSGSSSQANGQSSLNETTYYIGNEIETFVLNFLDTPGSVDVNVYLVRYGEIILLIDTLTISSVTDDLTINLAAVGKKAIIGDIIMIMPR